MTWKKVRLAQSFTTPPIFKEDCTKCQGTGRLKPTRRMRGMPHCDACRGVGKIYTYPGDVARASETAAEEADWAENGTEDTSSPAWFQQGFTPTSCGICGIEGTSESPYRIIAPHLKGIEIKLRDMIQKMPGNINENWKMLHTIHGILADASSDSPESK